ncbi:MAG TPA: Na+/H+ antiporter NhaC family protein [Alphaproteobacteria bacterium]|nr:Na+/H+ antiporter NhaC family protein [Alphaproteobacteria bacterium]
MAATDPTLPGSTEEPAQPARRPSLLDALIPVGGLIVLLALSFYLYGADASQGPNQIALVFAAVLATLISFKNGRPWASIRAGAVEGVSSGLAAIFILLGVGALIGTWAMSGTILAMVYYGLQLLSPQYFYASAALICAVVATAIGSSWTVAGTIGIGLMGIAATMELSLAITAGAVISGAYFGDKTSPLSDTANLAVAAAGSEIFSHIKESLRISVPALVLALVFFALIGSPGDFDASAELTRIGDRHHITLWAFLPLLAVFVLAMLRTPPFLAIFAGALLGGVLAVVQSPDKVLEFADAPDIPQSLALLKGAWSALATGYQSSTGDPALDQLLSRGGMASMMVTVWLIMTALAFGAVVEQAGLLNRLVDPIIDKAKSVAGLVGVVIGTAIGANLLTSDQYIAIMLPGRMFRMEFKRRGLAPVLLSRVVGDSATVTSPLIPWNSCGAYMAAALGIPASNYLIYCFFNLLNPLISFLFSLIGIGIVRVNPEAGDQTGDKHSESTSLPNMEAPLGAKTGQP